MSRQIDQPGWTEQIHERFVADMASALDDDDVVRGIDLREFAETFAPARRKREAPRPIHGAAREVVQYELAASIASPVATGATADALYEQMIDVGEGAAGVGALTEQMVAHDFHRRAIDRRVAEEFLEASRSPVREGLVGVAQKFADALGKVCVSISVFCAPERRGKGGVWSRRNVDVVVRNALYAPLLGSERKGPAGTILPDELLVELTEAGVGVRVPQLVIAAVRDHSAGSI